MAANSSRRCSGVSLGCRSDGGSSQDSDIVRQKPRSRACDANCVAPLVMYAEREARCPLDGDSYQAVFELTGQILKNRSNNCVHHSSRALRANVVDLLKVLFLCT